MSTYYEIKTLIDTVTMGLIFPVRALGVSDSFLSEFAASENYGYSILPLPPYIAQPGERIEEEVGYTLEWKLMPVGTSPGTEDIPSRIWMPNISSADYTFTNWRKAYFDYDPNSNNYYQSENSFGDPAGDPAQFYGMERKSRGVQVWYKKRYSVTPVSFTSRPKPSYIDLLSGYNLDLRSKPVAPTIISPVNETVTIGYYRENTLEKSDFRSIDWMSYSIILIKDTAYKLPIDNLVLGTLHCTNQLIVDTLLALPTVPGRYSYADYFSINLPILFAYWMSLYQASEIAPTIPVDATKISTLTETSRLLRCLGANNDVWKNRNTPTIDLNVDTTHPMFMIDNQRAYDWHIKPQFDINGNDKGIGTLTMDSPRTIEIHAALEAGKYATYLDKKTGNIVPRVSNLGWYVENIARVLGLRVDGQAYIDGNEEETYYLREIIDNPQYDKNAYGKNSFGRFGRLTPNLTNSFGSKAFDKFADIPQMLEVVMEHLNRSLGIQMGTEIEVLNSTTGKKDYYPNQLAMLLDIHAKITEIQLNSKENHNLITVVAHEIRELFSVMGAAISFKSLYTRYGKLMYIGHQADKGSILTSLTTIKINVGMLVGNLLIARPRNLKNPLERIFAKPSDKKKADQQNGQTKYF